MEIRLIHDGQCQYLTFNGGAAAAEASEKVSPIMTRTSVTSQTARELKSEISLI